MSAFVGKADISPVLDYPHQRPTRIGKEKMKQWRRRHSAPSLDAVAGNGLVDRRALLGGGLTFAGNLAAAANTTGAAAEPLADAPWSLAVGDVLPAVQTPSPFEKEVTRALSNPNGELRTSHARTPHHRLGGTITPNGLHFPSITAASRTSIRPSTSLSSMAWCASRLNSRLSRCRAIRW